jgi:hypothetical protein
MTRRRRLLVKNVIRDAVIAIAAALALIVAWELIVLAARVVALP